MTEPRLNDASAAPAAVAAFLRGVERRGAIFAQLLTGSARRGDEALVATLRAFRALVGTTAFTEWPRRFWSLLLASPILRKTPSDAAWPPAFSVLASLGRGPRAALLLRLVAGLGEADAAAVLGVARPTYRLALMRALPHRQDGAPDAESWQSLNAAAQAAVRQLPAERLAEIAGLRDAALQGTRATSNARANPQARLTPGPLRWLRSAVVIVTAMALAMTWWWPGRHASDDALVGIAIEPLPPADTPKSRYDDDATLLTHRDFDLLLAEEDSPAASDPAFHAWYAARLEQARREGDSDPLPLGDGAAPLRSADQYDATLDETGNVPL